MRPVMPTAGLIVVLAATLAALAPGVAPAQDSPRYGGELVFMVPAEPPSYDGHREGTFGTVHPLAPHYNTLLRIDPTDRTGTRPVPDLGGVLDHLARRAHLHLQAPAGRSLSRRQPDDVARRQGELRQDRLPDRGAHLGAQGNVSGGRGHRGPRSASSVRFRLKWPETSFLVNLASPFNWIYKADILARTPGGTRPT